MAEVRVTFSNFKDGSGHDDAARFSCSAAGVTPSETRAAECVDEGELELTQFLRTKRELIEQVRSGDEVSLPSEHFFERCLHGAGPIFRL